MQVDKRVAWIIGLITAVAIAVSAYLGIQLPTPTEPMALETRGGAVQVNKLVVQDTFTVGGATTQTGSLAADGGLTAGGGYGSTGCTVSTAGVLQCNGAATFAGGITDVVPILTKDASYQITAGDTGSIIKNTSVVSATFTLTQGSFFSVRGWGAWINQQNCCV